MSHQLTKQIIQWYKQEARNLPWRNTTDAYKIWLSEIILQQTRVNQGLPYYKRFINHYPTIALLASASEDEILYLWQGLGYYSRARNLLRCAKIIVENHQGTFPDDYNALKKLPGIGDYTASAIISFAYNRPYPAIDGNIIRLISRLFGIFDTPYGKESTQKIKSICEELIQHSPPAIYNQAMMEFGALQCSPKQTNCSICPLQDFCYAFQHQQVELLPSKKRKTFVKELFYYYILVEHKDYIYIQKREKNDIWKNLFQFPLIQKDQSIPISSISKEISVLLQINNFSIIHISPIIKHLLSHRKIYANFIHITINENYELKDYIKIEKKDIDNYAFPQLIRNYMTNYL